MFYVASAFLEGEGLKFSSHSAVIAAFGQHFARPGKVPAEFHQYLRKAQEVRRSGDYGPFDTVTVEEAREQISRAERFLQLAEDLMGAEPESNPEPA